MKTLNFHLEDEITFPERYLLGLTLSPSPAPEILQGRSQSLNSKVPYMCELIININWIFNMIDLFKLMKRTVSSPKLQESLILSVSAIAHTISTRSAKAGLPQSHLALEIEEYLINSLTSCDGENKGLCQQLYLRALKNLKSKPTVPLLFDALTTADSKTSVVAMKAIHAMPDSYIDPKYRPTLIKIIKRLGRKYDSSVRTLALDVILRTTPSKGELKELVKFLLENVVDKSHAEVSTFMWNRLHEFTEKNPSLRDFLVEIIKEESLVTYHHLSPRGLSTAFTRTFTSNSNGNSSFSNAIEMNGKILKRSLFDVNIQTKSDSLQLLSVNI